MPWYPPEEGEADVSFWYATYCAVGIGLMVGCVIYYYVWIKILPRVGHYTMRPETIFLDQDGSVTHRLRKIPNAELAEWDRTHDEAGNILIEAGVTTQTENEHLHRRVKVRDVVTESHSTEEKV